MIATTVLSVILLLATAVMINIGDLYYKGFNEARIQDAVRDTVDQIGQDVQLSDGLNPVDNTGTSIDLTTYGYSGSSTIKVVCMGDTRYTSVTGIQIGSNGPNADPTKQQIQHVLWRDTIPDNSICSPVDLRQSNPDDTSAPSTLTQLAGSNGQELVPSLSRLTSFCVNNDGTCAGATGAYGIEVGIVYGSLDLSPPPNNLCTGGAGDQFCASDQLTASVESRLSGN
jgi:hypothetical protein